MTAVETNVERLLPESYDSCISAVDPKVHNLTSSSKILNIMAKITDHFQYFLKLQITNFLKPGNTVFCNKRI